mmetsp:Transcript_12945/g.38041  ORF Transcript_12945/g.38041 Transcript_12945/m.38041 type:complete len:203 (-) Transcript_12945:531-1139(-)
MSVTATARGRSATASWSAPSHVPSPADGIGPPSPAARSSSRMRTVDAGILAETADATRRPTVDARTTGSSSPAPSSTSPLSMASSISSWWSAYRSSPCMSAASSGTSARVASASASISSSVRPAWPLLATLRCLGPTRAERWLTSTRDGSRLSSWPSLARRCLKSKPPVTSNCTPKHRRYTPFESCTGRMDRRFWKVSPFLR